MIWPRVRGSPAAVRVSASRLSAAWTATPWATGRSAAQVGHHVGRGPQSHPPVGLGAAAPGHERGGVERVGEASHLGDQLGVAHRLEPLGAGAARQLGVDLLPVGEGQAGGLARDQCRPPLGDPSRGERGARVRQLPVGQDLRQAEMLPAPVRRLPPGQRDLVGDATTLPHDGHTLVGGPPALRGVEVSGQHRLRRLGDALEHLQGTDQVDPVGVGGRPVHPRLQRRGERGDRRGVDHQACCQWWRRSLIEHTFDSTRSRRPPHLQ